MNYRLADAAQPAQAVVDGLDPGDFIVHFFVRNANL